jgi:NDP-sugar pyrophosphorylase family protein
MESLPPYTNPASLWPSLKNNNAGHVPFFTDNVPWSILKLDGVGCLKSQLLSLLEEIGTNIPKDLNNCTIDNSQGVIHIDDSATIGPAVHITGPCYIGPNVDVRHAAFVRANTWACAGSVIGHCSEIKHSILLPNAKAPHFNYVGDSIIGGGVNLGAGVKLSNLRHDGKEVMVRIQNERIPSGIRKFGAILGEGVQLGCNSVTNPGVILGNNTMSSANSTISGVHPPNSIIR